MVGQETLPPQQHVQSGCSMADTSWLHRSSSTRQYFPKSRGGHQSSLSLDFGPLDEEACSPSAETIPARGRLPGLSQKYQPKVFDEIVGHEMVIRALRSAVQSRRVSSLYLFHGPGGTGKTSAANVFAMALNCESTLPSKPCWGCTGCSRSLYTAELCSGSRISGFDNIKTLLWSTGFLQTFHGFKVFVIDECQSLPDDTWGHLLDTIEQENGCGSLVFIVIVEDVSKVPRAVSSRCQKFSFAKLKGADIKLKLRRIMDREGIEIESDVLKLIAEKVDGDLREAENLLNQLALLGQNITTSMVQQLVGLVPREKLLHLLEAALFGDSAGAVRTTKDLITCCVEPQGLLLQLASLVTEILLGACYSPTETSLEKSSVQGCTRLGSIQPKRLHRALKILIDTEKQLRLSSCNHAAWVTAALLQIASYENSNHNLTDISPRKSVHPADDTVSAASRINSADINTAGPSNTTDKMIDTKHLQSSHLISDQLNVHTNKMNPIIESMNLEEIWRNVLGRLNNNSLEEFLRSQTKLMSLTVSRANAIVHLMFIPSERTPSFDMCEDSISKALEDALGCPVTINVSHDPVQLKVVPRDYVSSIGEKVSDPTHQEQHKTHLLERNRSQKSALLSRNNSRSKMTGNNGHLQFQKSEHARRRDGGNDTISEETSVLSSNLRQGSKDIVVEPELGISIREQSHYKIPIAKSTEHRNKVPPMSSILKTDASVEPYSQDLLFEAANSDKLRGSRNSRIYDDLHGDNMDYMGVTRSWSCTERFCKGEKAKVKGSMKERNSLRNCPTTSSVAQ